MITGTGSLRGASYAPALSDGLPSSSCSSANNSAPGQASQDSSTTVIEEESGCFQ